MIIENVIPILVCINYSDLLALTLQQNRGMFKHFYVVTEKSDTNTIKLCEKYQVNVHLTNITHKDNAYFNKSGMIHEVQKVIHAKFPTSWVLILDADIYLPDNFLSICSEKKLKHLDHDALYSLKRIDFHTYEDFEKKENGKEYIAQFMGYFQMYYDKTKYYAPHSSTCGKCDYIFSTEFRKKYYLNETFQIYHLGEDGKNWEGRVTPVWNKIYDKNIVLKDKVYYDIIPMVVCIQFSDYLKVTLPQNRKLFHSYYVITLDDDIETQRICKANQVEVLTVGKELLYENGASFNKAGVVHEMQRIVHFKHPKCWYLLMDADIYLPDTFPEILPNTSELSEQYMYSLKRRDFHTPKDFEEKKNGVPFEFEFMGYFQLYYDSNKYYPKHSMTCEKCDYSFAYEFRRKAYLHDTFEVYHLGRYKEDWFGRVSDKWVPYDPNYTVNQRMSFNPAYDMISHNIQKKREEQEQKIMEEVLHVQTEKALQDEKKRLADKSIVVNDTIESERIDNQIVSMFNDAKLFLKQQIVDKPNPMKFLPSGNNTQVKERTPEQKAKINARKFQQVISQEVQKAITRSLLQACEDSNMTTEQLPEHHVPECRQS